MALLLAMYQKFKLTREKNTLSYKLARHSSKLDRLQNNISKKQKYYEGLLKKAEKKATDFKNMFKLQLQNAYGLGTSVFNPAAGSAFANQAIGNIMCQAMAQGVEVWQADQEGKQVTGTDGKPVAYKWQHSNAANIAALFMQYGTSLTKLKDGTFGVQGNSISAQDYNYAQQVYQLAYQQNSLNQQYVAAATQQYETNASIWYEAYEAQITAEQDSVLGAMEYEESMMELDKVNMETRLERIKAELETYTSLLSEEAKNTAPKFGLG